MLKQRIKELEKDIKKNFDMSLTNTGKEIIDAYGWNEKILKKEMFELGYFPQGRVINFLCDPLFANKIVNDGFKITDDIYDEKTNKCHYSYEEKEFPVANIKKFIDYIISIEPEETVEIYFIYYSINLCHVIVNKNGIIDVTFDEIENYDPASDGIYVSEYQEQQFWFYHLLVLSYDVPLKSTFKMLKIIN